MCFWLRVFRQTFLFSDYSLVENGILEVYLFWKRRNSFNPMVDVYLTIHYTVLIVLQDNLFSMFSYCYCLDFAKVWCISNAVGCFVNKVMQFKRRYIQNQMVLKPIYKDQLKKIKIYCRVFFSLKESSEKEHLTKMVHHIYYLIPFAVDNGLHHILKDRHWLLPGTSTFLMV